MDYFYIEYPADGDIFPESVIVEYRRTKGGYFYRRYNTEILPGDYISSNWRRISGEAFYDGIAEKNNY